MIQQINLQFQTEQVFLLFQTSGNIISIYIYLFIFNSLYY